MTYKRWEGQPPQITFDKTFTSLGRTPALQVKVEDVGTGLRQVSIHLKQKDKDTILVDDSFAKAGVDKSKVYDLGKLITAKGQMEDGPATLEIHARDYALVRGNAADSVQAFTFDTTPPVLEVLSGQHYINQGGSECVVYRVSEDVQTSGVQVGTMFFPGYPVDPANPKLRFALFALKYDLPVDTPVHVMARDAAGNEVTASFWQKVFPKKFRSRDIPLRLSSARAGSGGPEGTLPPTACPVPLVPPLPAVPSLSRMYPPRRAPDRGLTAFGEGEYRPLPTRTYVRL